MQFGVDASDFPGGAAVIFGGSGGVGKVAAGLIAERGSAVVVSYRSSAEEAERTVEAIKQAGGRACAMQCDVRDRSAVRALFTKAASTFGGLHTVICAQGGKYALGPLADASDEGLREKLETDVIGFLNVSQEAIPLLRAGGGGSLTAIISPQLARATAGYGLAAVPKVAVAGMVRTYALEEGPNNIRVNGISLGVIDTGMTWTLSATSKRSILEGVVAATPLRRMGKASEVAELLAFLASSKAAYITGQLILIDGGYSL